MKNADWILYNGVVHTLTDAGDASALAMADGKILAAGSDADILALAGSETKKTDLAGACVLPAFNDSHCHLRLTGEGAERLDLRGVRSRGEIVERGRAYAETHDFSGGEWIVGYGFDHNIFPDRALPDIGTAEAISENVPVLLDRVCGHVGAANRAALRIAGFDESTVIQGGVLDRGPGGRLNGILREAALDQIKMKMKKPDAAMAKDQLRSAMRIMNSHGVTAAQTDDLEGSDLDTLLAAFAALEKEGGMTVRVFEEVQAARMPLLEKFLSRGLRTGDGTEWFRIGNIKLLTDGSLGARTAYLRADYCDDPGNRGVSVYTQDELDEIVLAAHTAGMQCAFHAIGDGAAERAVTAVERAQRAERKDLRHRIVHCQFADEDIFRRMAAAGMCADAQPAFVASDWPLVRSRLGAEREAGAYAWKSLIKSGVCVGGGSDSPVDPPDPIFGIYCAAARRGADGKPDGGWHPEQRVSVLQAVHMYTTAGAYLSFDESRKGRLAPGMLADITVLSRDILAVPPEEIPKTKVLMTIAGGKACFGA
jgi:predicted amidohydrolase YtcJ